MRDIEKKYNVTKWVAEVQYEYIRALEATIKENGITSEDIQKVSEKLKSKDYEDFKVSKSLNIESAMAAVCKYYNADSRDVFSNKRYAHMVRPRHIVCYIAKHYIPTMTLKRIGWYLGGRDHSTVIHGIRSISDEMSYNKTLRMEVEEIIESLKV